MSQERGNAAKRWCFTINNPTPNDYFWENHDDHMRFDDKMVNVQYLVCQEERGEQGTLHIQGFLILKEKQRLSWMKRRMHRTCHWEIARGTNTQASDYCKKDETYTGGLRIEVGEFKKYEGKKRAEMLAEAAEELDEIKEAYKRPKEVGSLTLMQCGFTAAYNLITNDILGPYRPKLQVITMVGPPGSGKSYAIQHFFPDHGRAMYGNNGVWFQNPTAPVMIFEEFNGQIPLHKMLELLDVYPLALEVKGRMAPAMYETVVLTSNTIPSAWYSCVSGGVVDERRKNAIQALYDRLGYDDGGNYHPVRTCGHYLGGPALQPYMQRPAMDYVMDCRKWFWEELAKITHRDPIEDDTDLD